MLSSKLALIIVGFISLTVAQEETQTDSLFSLFKKQTKPNTGIKWKPPKVDHDLQKWREQTNQQFKNCDTNRSGFITRAEYIACSPYQNNWNQLVAEFDSNYDGMLNWNEVYQAVRQSDDRLYSLQAETPSQDQLDAEVVDSLLVSLNGVSNEILAASPLMDLAISRPTLELKTLHKVIDANEDGGISQDEIYKALQLLQLDKLVQRYQVNSLIQRLDKSYDGKLQLDELAPQPTPPRILAEFLERNDGGRYGNNDSYLNCTEIIRGIEHSRVGRNNSYARDFAFKLLNLNGCLAQFNGSIKANCTNGNTVNCTDPKSPQAQSWFWGSTSIYKRDYEDLINSLFTGKAWDNAYRIVEKLFNMYNTNRSTQRDARGLDAKEILPFLRSNILGGFFARYKKIDFYNPSHDIAISEVQAQKFIDALDTDFDGMLSQKEARDAILNEKTIDE